MTIAILKKDFYINPLTIPVTREIWNYPHHHKTAWKIALIATSAIFLIAAMDLTIGNLWRFTITNYQIWQENKKLATVQSKPNTLSALNLKLPKIIKYSLYGGVAGFFARNYIIHYTSVALNLALEKTSHFSQIYNFILNHSTVFPWKVLLIISSGIVISLYARQIFRYFFPVFSLSSANKKNAVSHDSSKWIATYSVSPEEQKKKRKDLFQQTKIAAIHGFWTPNGWFKNATYYQLDRLLQKQMQENTCVMIPNKIPPEAARTHITAIQVVNNDSIDCGLLLKKEGYNPVILNMANEDIPGGGVENGSAAQEEEIFRRSDYFLSLYYWFNPFLKRQLPIKILPKILFEFPMPTRLLLPLLPFYKIPEFGNIYSPSVQIFRKSLEEGYEFCSPQSLSFIATAGYNLGNLFAKPFGYEEGMKEKIRAILRTAYGKGHDSVVLGALGCGAFNNDPNKVADYFRKVFSEPEFSGIFKRITFAVLNDRNGSKNYEIFKEKLNNLIINRS